MDQSVIMNCQQSDMTMKSVSIIIH